MKDYYNSGNSICINQSIYPGIKTTDDLFDVLQYCWTEQTCTERLRTKFSDKNKTAGQCAITSFLVQDIFGGDIYGLDTGRGKHWYNVVDGIIFDLTSAQFGEEAKNLKYDLSFKLNSREDIWNQTGKKERYLLLKENLNRVLPKTISVNNNQFNVLCLLGHGKGGYSYLAVDSSGKKFVVKQIHHEPCSYYSFGDKIQSEINDYERLKKTGIPIPLMIDVDKKSERILKEFIDGPTIAKLVKFGKMKVEYINQVEEMCRILYASNTNIDYYPTNFVVQDEKLFYIDYECNDYMQEWDFEHWGKQYWI